MPTSTGCLKLRKANWYLSRPPKQSPLKPTESHKSPQKNWPQGMCSHKCREDKTITLIVAKSPQIDLVVLRRATNVPAECVCVKETQRDAH